MMRFAPAATETSEYIPQISEARIHSPLSPGASRDMMLRVTVMADHIMEPPACIMPLAVRRAKIRIRAVA